MTSHHHSKTNSHVPNSIISASPPQSDHSERPLLFMCSFGGEILPRRHNANQLCYIGGDTRILSVNGSVKFLSLLNELSDLTGDTEIAVKYHLPNEDLHALILLENDKDVEKMIMAYNQLIRSGLQGSAQLLRLFLFPRNSSNLVSHTNDHLLVMEQNSTNMEEFYRNKLAFLLERSQPQSVLTDGDRGLVEPSRKWNTIEIPSALQNLETLWTWLNDKNVYTIKIEGECLTGISWMVRHIIDRARESSLFESIIWAENFESNEYVGIPRGWSLIDLGVTIDGPHPHDFIIDGPHDFLWWDTLLKRIKGGYLMVVEQCSIVHSMEIKFQDLSSMEGLSKIVYVGSPLNDFGVPMDKVLDVKLSQTEAWLVFQNRSGLQLDDSEVCKYAEPLLQKCNGNFPMILLLAASLRRNLEESSTTFRAIDTLQRASDLLIDRSMFIVEVVCELFPSKQVRDCFIYFLRYNSVNYTEKKVSDLDLITFWMFQGCLDGYNCLADAYKRGQDILLELIDSCLLVRYDNEYVTPSMHTLFEASEGDMVKNNYFNPAVGSYLDSQNMIGHFLMNEVLEIKYNLQRSYRWGLLVYGNEERAPHEIPDGFFEKMKTLWIFSLQHTRIKSLPLSLSTLERLQTLLLKDCPSLEDVNQIRELSQLRCLDLSGASSLNNLPDNFFENMNYLCHLDLSNTQLKNFPSSFYNLTELQYLCLQGCSRLQLFLERFSFPSLINLKHLLLGGCLQIQTIPHIFVFPYIQVLDLSGAIAFKYFQGEPVKTYYSFRKIDLSDTKVVDVHFLSRCSHLHEILLKKCSKIETVPCLSREVEILDLSGSVSFKKFEDESLGDKLLRLDLSRTQIEKLPTFSIDSRLSHLLLRECAGLEELQPSEFQKLEVLDLSGSINFKKFKDVSSMKLRRLRTLDLSATQIIKLPHLSECSQLQHLVLRICSRLETLPELKELTNIEVLDLSGASAFRKFQDTDMEKMVKLQELNLSGTQVVRIPSLDECHDLRSLILRGCSKLERLPQLEALSKLQVLDLSGSVSFKTFQDQSLGSKCHLQILDLSETQVSELPLLSGCSNLCQLLLRDCSKLKILPPIHKPTRLEVLDLSGTNNLDISFLSECQNLLQLSLRGCSNLDSVSFECMHDLEKVDLSGTSIQMLPSCFSKFRNLNQLLVKECSSLKTIPNLESCYNLEVLDISWQRVEERSSGIPELAYSRLLVTVNSKYLWEFDYAKDFQRFHVCLCSRKDWEKEKDMYFQNRDAFLRNMYYQVNHIPQLTEESDTFLKICGFQTFPSGAEEVLINTEHLYLENNDFIGRLSDLGANHVKAMKECWIESCQNIGSCFYGEEKEENDALGNCLQNLWVSKLSNLKCLFRDVVNSNSFTCLKNLYIECCPSLITLFSSHLELKHLDTLKIKFCDKLENVSGDMVLAEQTFPRLKILTLWKLPKLHRVCTGALPSLECIAVKKCPKLEKLPLSLNSTSRSLKIKGEKLWWDNLKCEDDAIKSHISFTEFLQFLLALREKQISFGIFDLLVSFITDFSSKLKDYSEEQEGSLTM